MVTGTRCMVELIHFSIIQIWLHHCRGFWIFLWQIPKIGQKSTTYAGLAALVAHAKMYRSLSIIIIIGFEHHHKSTNLTTVITMHSSATLSLTPSPRKYHHEQSHRPSVITILKGNQIYRVNLQSKNTIFFVTVKTKSWRWTIRLI